jgi:hypothetical protein
MHRIFWILLTFGLVFLLISPQTFAKIGVGIGTGKILVEERLKPGKTYELPPLTVLNTGDEASGYKVTITYHQDQPEKMPLIEWFTFSPDNFTLNPGEAQVVEVSITLPVKTEPGDYFAYLEAAPTESSVGGVTKIGIAAAAKLYFTVDPANLLQGVIYRISSVWKAYMPWDNIAAGFIALIILVLTAKKYLHIQVSVGAKGTESINVKK